MIEPKMSVRKLRVALNAISDVNSKYGSHVYLIELARTLVRSPDVDLSLFVARGSINILPEELRSIAVEIDARSSGSYWQAAYQSRIQKALLAENVDVYHIPNTLPFFRKVIPTVVSIHDLAELRLKKYGWFRTTYRRTVNRVAAKAADHVLTLSENSKCDIVNLLGVPPEKITVTFAGVDGRFRAFDRSCCTERLSKVHGIESNFILAPGGFSRNKNIQNILSAFAELHARKPEVSLVLTGYGTSDELKETNREISRLRLRGSVITTGYVSADEMPYFYGASLLVIYPSYYEGLGLPALEAMASGVPLIVSNTSSLPEVVGDAAVMVSPSNPGAIAAAMNEVLENRELREKMIVRGRDRADRFKWSTTAKIIVDVYRQVSLNPGFTGAGPQHSYYL